MDVTKDMRLDHSPKIVLERDTFNDIRAYAPYVRLEEHLKVKFRKDLEDLLQDISLEEKKNLGGELNEHIRSVSRCFKGLHENYGLEEVNGG